MSVITELQLILQKPIDPDLNPWVLEAYEGRVFATEGQSEVRKISKTSRNQYVENTLDILPVRIPSGVTGARDMVRAVVLRHMRDHKDWDPEWLMFYVIAKFEGTAADGKETEFFRTLIPRTEINVSLRGVRRGNVRHRKHGPKSSRRVRRKKL
jgi:hypothetical protein